MNCGRLDAGPGQNLLAGAKLCFMGPARLNSGVIPIIKAIIHIPVVFIIIMHFYTGGQNKALET